MLVRIAFMPLLGLFAAAGASAQMAPVENSRMIDVAGHQIESDGDGRYIAVHVSGGVSEITLPLGADRDAIFRYIEGQMYAKASCLITIAGELKQCRFDKRSAVGRKAQKAALAIARVTRIPNLPSRMLGKQRRREIEFLAADGGGAGDRLTELPVTFGPDGIVPPPPPPPPPLVAK